MSQQTLVICQRKCIHMCFNESTAFGRHGSQNRGQNEYIAIVIMQFFLATDCTALANTNKNKHEFLVDSTVYFEIIEIEDEILCNKRVVKSCHMILKTAVCRVSTLDKPSNSWIYYYHYFLFLWRAEREKKDKNISQFEILELMMTLGESQGIKSVHK